MAREEHIQAVGFAGLQIQELQQVILHAQEKQATCLALVITAVGENPSIDSAQNATAFTASLGDKLTEILGICEQAIAELNRYGGGF
jgi:hypothetical protein